MLRVFKVDGLRVVEVERKLKSFVFASENQFVSCILALETNPELKSSDISTS